jgi:serine/threonine protein kinase
VTLSLPALGSIVAGKYRVEALLGEGGMGAVFRAHHELMDKTVALKWLHPRLWDHAEAKERFLREARIVARIRHPNVVEVFDICPEPDALFMVMEFLQGQSFEQLLQQGRLSTSRALSLALGAMRGVAAAHARGIIHRDIKAENIFVARNDSGEEQAKILDFGISKLLEDAGGGEAMTKTGVTMGTPAYMSFEHISGARDVDERTDVYSFGVLLYRVLTDELPYGSDSFANVAVRLATTRAPAPNSLRPSLSERLSHLVMKAMAFERDDRYASMTALIDALAPLNTDAGLMSSLAPVTDTKDGRVQRVAERLGAPLPSTRGPLAPQASEPMRTAPPPRARRGLLWSAPLALGVLGALIWSLGDERDAREPSPARPPTLPASGRLNDAAAGPALSPPLKETAAGRSDDWESAAQRPIQVEAPAQAPAQPPTLNEPEPEPEPAQPPKRTRVVDAGASHVKTSEPRARPKGAAAIRTDQF